MKKLGTAILLLAIIGLSTSVAVGQDSARAKIFVSTDVLGPILSIPFHVENSSPRDARGFFRISPEVEFWVPGLSDFSVVLDAEFFRTEWAFGPVETFGSEWGRRSEIVTLRSIIVGVRRYWMGSGAMGVRGFFTELQTGYVHERVDTVHRWLSFEPEIDDFSTRSYLALRLRLGYQVPIIKRLILSPSMLLDMRRLLQNDRWIRNLIFEVNFGVSF